MMNQNPKQKTNCREENKNSTHTVESRAAMKTAVARTNIYSAEHGRKNTGCTSFSRQTPLEYRFTIQRHIHSVHMQMQHMLLLAYLSSCTHAHVARITTNHRQNRLYCHADRRMPSSEERDREKREKNKIQKCLL